MPSDPMTQAEAVLTRAQIAVQLGEFADVLNGLTVSTRATADRSGGDVIFTFGLLAAELETQLGGGTQFPAQLIAAACCRLAGLDLRAAS